MSEEWFFNREMETLSQFELEALQLERLQQSVFKSMNAPVYRDGKFAGKLDPEGITSLDDIRRIRDGPIVDLTK